MTEPDVPYRDPRTAREIAIAEAHAAVRRARDARLAGQEPDSDNERREEAP